VFAPEGFRGRVGGLEWLMFRWMCTIFFYLWCSSTCNHRSAVSFYLQPQAIHGVSREAPTLPAYLVSGCSSLLDPPPPPTATITWLRQGHHCDSSALVLPNRWPHHSAGGATSPRPPLCLPWHILRYKHIWRGSIILSCQAC
jgi:hypothetical protein